MKWKPVVVEYAGWEIFLMRLGMAVLLWLRMPGAVGMDTQPYPNGIAHWLDLTFLADARLFSGLHGIFAVMLVLYVSGRGLALALPFLLFLNLTFNTLANSQGWIGHTDQILSLVLLVQTIFHLGLLLRKWMNFPALLTRPGQLEIYLTLQTIAATYVVAGLSKLIKTGGSWIAQLPNITVQLVKTNDQFYYDQLTHPHPGLAEWLNQMLISHPALAYPLFAPGLLLELAAVIIPFGRKPAFIMGVVLLGMHGLIHFVMQITFTTNMALLVIYLLNIPYFAVAAFRWGRSRMS